VAALAVNLLRDGGQLGHAGRAGELHTVVLDLENGPAIVTPVDVRHTLVIFAQPDTDIGPLLFEIRQQREAVSAAI
jgi:predicted regulator of Ras-like GTPase activity (Roadblock/LC7/MglB family)